MNWISTFDKIKTGKIRLPIDAIIYRTMQVNYRSSFPRSEFLIPAQIANRVGIVPGTMVDVMVDPELNRIRISVIKEGIGFRVKNFNEQRPCVRISIRFQLNPGLAHFPISAGKNILIRKYDYDSGLCFSMNLINKNSSDREE